MRDREEEDAPCIPGLEPADVPTTPADRVAPRYGVADVRAMYSVSAATVYRWVGQGRIPSPDYSTGRATWTHSEWVAIQSGIQPPGTFARKYSPAADRATEQWHQRRVADALRREKREHSRRKAAQTRAAKRSQTPPLPGHGPAPVPPANRTRKGGA